MKASPDFHQLARERVSVLATERLLDCQIISDLNVGLVAQIIASACEQYSSGQVYNEIREEHAVAAHGGKPVKKCEMCLGNGWYGIEAGDGEWTEECEPCAGTGFVLKED